MSTFTITETFTLTHARHIASRIAGDLRLMNLYYDRPSLEDIANYLEEAARLLAGRWLDWVEYGFKRGEERVFTLRYTAMPDGSLADSRAGGVLPNQNVTGTTFYSYLSYSEAWSKLRESERNAIEASLPVKRVFRPSPRDGQGYWVADRSYSAGGGGVEQKTFRPC